MREYIVNLTNNLIGKHGFDLMFESMKAQGFADGWQSKFVKFVCDTISSRDVRTWSPETLGKVMCSLDGNELPCINPGLYFGKPEQTLRDFVSNFLAWSICYRLDASALERHNKIPAYAANKTANKIVCPKCGGSVKNIGKTDFRSTESKTFLTDLYICSGQPQCVHETAHAGQWPVEFIILNGEPHIVEPSANEFC